MYTLEVLHGVLYPEAHNNRFRKNHTCDARTNVHGPHGRRAFGLPRHNVTGQYQNHLGIPKSRLGRARDQNHPHQKPTETSPLAVTRMISKV